MVKTAAKAEIRPEHYYTDGERLIYVISKMDADAEVEDCRTGNRMIVKLETLEGWQDPREEATNGN